MHVRLTEHTYFNVTHVLEKLRKTFNIQFINPVFNSQTGRVTAFGTSLSNSNPFDFFFYSSETPENTDEEPEKEPIWRDLIPFIKADIYTVSAAAHILMSISKNLLSCPQSCPTLLVLTVHQVLYSIGLNVNNHWLHLTGGGVRKSQRFKQIYITHTCVQGMGVERVLYWMCFPMSP